jgi:prepilin-type N-terminal cleavage/methylation domain-containing protein
MTRRGFTLIELMVATVVAAVMTAGVLMIVARLSRDRVLISKKIGAPTPDCMIDLLRWDFANAQGMLASPRADELILFGHGGIDGTTLTATGRVSRVAYRIEPSADGPQLIREQRYLDDRGRPQAWRELVARNVETITALPATLQLPAPLGGALANVADAGARQVPPRVRLLIRRGKVTIDQELAVR